MICSKCGNNLDSFSALSCPSCGNFYADQDTMSPPPPTPEPSIPLWESPAAKNYPLMVFFLTVKQIFSTPERFFSTLQLKKNLSSAWLFALIAGSIGYSAAFLWSQILPDSISVFFDKGILKDSDSSPASTLMFTPIYISIEFFFVALYAHFMLFIMRKNKSTFYQTLKIAAYSQCALLLNLIPVIGSLLASVLFLWQLITGISVVHHTTRIKAFTALILPLILLAVFCVLLLLLLAFLGVALSGIFGDILPFLEK